MYNQIPYRVFVNLSSSDRTVLHQAEWTIRKETPNALAKAMNNELWTFSLDERITPPGPSESFDLRETSTGVFLVSTLSENGNIPPPYQPFIYAVKSLLCTRLAALNKFVLFGNDGLSLNGQLYYVSPYLTRQGDLILKLFSDDCLSGLHRPLTDRELLPNSKVVLIPSVHTARFVQLCESPSSDLNLFLQLLELSTTVDFSSTKMFHFRRWAQFRLESNGKVIIWPLDLCLIPSITDKSASDDLDWLNVQDIFRDVTHQISSISAAVNRPALVEQPPPQQNHGQIQRSTSLQHSTHVVTEEAKKVLSAVYPTPPDAQSRHRNDADTVESSNWITPSAGGNFNQDAGWADLDTDLFGDDEEITEADFNFFDQPELEEAAAVPHIELPLLQEHASSDIKVEAVGMEIDVPEESVQIKQVHNIFISNDTSPEPKISENAVDQQIKILTESNIDENDSSLSMAKRRKASIFSPISFNPVIASRIDAKYELRGRFFVPKPISSDDSSMEESSDDELVEASERQTPKDEPKKLQHQPHHQSQNNDQVEIDGSLRTQRMKDWVSTLICSSQLDYTELAFLDKPPLSEFTATQPDFDEVLHIFINQIVWDNGLFDSLADSHRSYPNGTLVKRVKDIFPTVQQLSLQDFIQTTSYQASDENKLGTDEGKVFDSTEEENAANNEYRLSDKAHAMSRQREPPVPEIFQIPTPCYAVNRLGHLMKARAPILRFWKIFGLNPVNGLKSSRVFIFCPSGPGVISDSEFFLDYFRSTYEGCGLGDLLAGQIPVKDEALPKGVIPYGFDPMNLNATVENITSVMISVLKGIESEISPDIEVVEEDGKIVPAEELLLLLVDPFGGNLSQLFQMCRSLLKIQNTSKTSVLNINAQIVPQDLVSTRDVVSLASQTRMIKFALGAYDKIAGTDLKNIEIASSGNFLQREKPAYTLARTSPPKINFRLSLTPSISLMNEDSVLHFGYSVSADRKWVTAAWSDQWGELSKAQAYTLGRGATSRLLEDVLKDIWKVTLEITRRLSVRWRIVIAKSAPMEEREFNCWNQLIDTTELKTVGTCFILSTSLRNSLLLTSESNGNFLFPFNESNAVRPQIPATTPITPQRNTDNDSPDAFGASVITPTSGGAMGSNQSDYLLGEKGSLEDAVIVDVKDDTYGIVLPSHGYTSLEYANLYKSPLNVGLLVKPGLDSGDDDNMAQCLEVLLLRNPVTADGVLKSLLVHYRKLASLGTFAGTTKHSNSVIPWHLAATHKMIQALECIV